MRAFAVLQRISWNAVRGGRRRIAIGQPGAGKRRPGHLQLADHDAQHLLQHLFFADGGVDLPRSLKQRLQARHLLLQVDRLAIARKLNSSRHCAPPSVESHSSMAG
jgi:hypothetical protein